MAIEEVVAGQVFTGRRTSLRSGSTSQVFAGSRTASEDKDAGHRPDGGASVGHAFKIGGRVKARRRVRFPSASAWRFRRGSVEPTGSTTSPRVTQQFATRLDALGDHRGTAAAGLDRGRRAQGPGWKRPAGRRRTRRGVRALAEGTHPHVVTPVVNLREQSVSRAPR